MKIMKKTHRSLIALLLCLTLLLTGTMLTGCAKKTETQETPSTPAVQNSDTQPSGSEAPAEEEDVQTEPVVLDRKSVV